jgi:hypothetical protein
VNVIEVFTGLGLDTLGLIAVIVSWPWAVAPVIANGMDAAASPAALPVLRAHTPIRYLEFACVGVQVTVAAPHSLSTDQVLPS